MSKGRFKRLQKYWWVIVILVLVVSGIFTLWIEGVTIPNPNSNLRNKNDPSLDDRTEEGLRFFLGGMVDTLDSEDLGIVEYWANRSILGIQTSGYILYFNGEHSEYYNESIPLSDYNNELRWWTGFQSFETIIFDSFDSSNRTTFTIPKQDAGTEVIYQLRLQEWNEPQWIYEKFNMTYVVLFSESEVQYEISLHGLVYTYIRIDLIVIFFILVIKQPWKEKETPPPSQITRGRVYRLSVNNLISRAGHIEGQLSGVRTGASILLTLASGVFTFLVSTISFAGSIGLLSMIVGPSILAVLTFIGLIQSFASLEIKNNGYSLGTSLIPDDMSGYMYKKLLPEAVERREEVLKKSLESIKVGIIYFFSFMLTGIIFLFLPDVQNFGDRLELGIPSSVSFLLTTIAVYLLVINTARRSKIIDWE